MTEPPSGVPDLPPLPELPVLPPLPVLDAPRQRPPAGGARREWQTATVVEVRRETGRVSTFRLALPVWHPHLPGQHYVVRLTAPDGYRAERSYSVASPPADVGHVELAVERLEDGEVSGYLHEAVRAGDGLEVRGPFGGWFVWRADAPALLVGGGSGVVPLVAVLRHARATASPLPVRLVVSARSAEELLFASEYGEETTVVLTRSAKRGSSRPPGRMAAADLAPAAAAVFGGGAAGATAYVCGSAGFAGAAERLLAEVGVPAASTRVERFGPG